MPMRIREVAEHPLGLTWIVDDPLLRASHALVHDGRVWFVDPVDAPEAIERAPRSASPPRCCSCSWPTRATARRSRQRLNVPHLTLPDVLPDSPFSVLDISLGPWKERALWWPEPRGLIVAGVDRHRVALRRRPRPAGVHFLRRALPPSQLKPFLPEHLLVGHGEPSTAAKRPPRCSTRSTARAATFRRFVWKAPGILRSMHGRR